MQITIDEKHPIFFKTLKFLLKNITAQEISKLCGVCRKTIYYKLNKLEKLYSDN